MEKFYGLPPGMHPADRAGLDETLILRKLARLSDAELQAFEAECHSDGERATLVLVDREIERRIDANGAFPRSSGGKP